MNPSDNTFCSDKPEESTGFLAMAGYQSMAAGDKKALMPFRMVLQGFLSLLKG